MFGQEAANQPVAPDQELPAGWFQKVGANWIYFDNVMIGEGWANRADGWFENFTAMSQVDKLTFFNVRTGSRHGFSYTNMDTIDQIGRPFRLESFGIRLNYPDPNVSGQHTMQVAAAKFFTTALVEHCYLEFFIRDDQWFTLKPQMCPSGYGAIGFFNYNGVTPSSSHLITNGQSHSLNRWRWLDNGIKIPETSQIRLTMTFSEYGKQMLQELGTVNPLDGVSEEPFPNVANIEVSIRGRRYSQMRGKYYK